MAEENKKAEIVVSLNATGVREGVADGKAAIKDFADTVTTESTKANKSLASLGAGSTLDNVNRLEKAFADVGTGVEQSLGKADRATKAFVTKIRQSASVAGSVTQETVDKLAGSLFLNKKVDAAAVQPYIAALQKLADENAQLKTATDAQTVAQGKANTAAAAAAAQFSNFERSAQAARIELLSFGKTAAEKFEIRATLTGLDKNAATQQIIADLKAAEAAAVAAGKGIGTGLQQPLERVGMSAKATAAALRQVPAQFTDIIVSLQGGQAPLTVLLQQGGQLKDVFGGIGPAAQALGGYIAGLINPFTLAAGAAAALAVAYNQGSKEADAYNKALILTGNAAGVTAGRLAAMAQSIGAVTGGTVGAAAEAVAAFASSGNIAASQIEKFSATAIGLQKTMGIAVGDTVKQFEELGKEPVKASAKLNETTRFLTLSVYEQIKALEDQGRVAEAGALAQNAYDAAMKTRIGAIKDNLGLLEKAWAGVKKQAALAWDDMLGVGRKADPVKEAADTLKAAQEKLAQIRGDSKGATGYSVGGYATDIAAQEKVVAELKKQVDYNAAIESSKGRAAAYAAREAKLLESKIGFDREGLEFATAREKREKAISEQTTKAQDLLKAGLITQVEYETRLSNIREKFKDPVGKKGTVGDPFEADRSAAKEWAKFYEDFTKLAANAKGEVDDLSKSEKKWLEYLESPAWANATNEMRDLATAQAYAAIVAEDAAKVEKDYEKQIKASTAAHLALVNAQDKRTENAQEQLQKQLASNAAIGLSADAVGELEAANILLTAAELERKANLQDGVMLSAELIDKYREEAAVLRNLAEAKRVGGVKKAADEADKDWKKASEKINDSITDALLRGFESGKGFAENLRDTVVNMFKTMVLRPTVSAIVTGLSGGAFGGAANAATTATGLSNAGGLIGGVGQMAAIGTAFGEGFVSTLAGNSLTIAAQAAGGGTLAGIGGAIGAVAPYALAAAAVYALLTQDKNYVKSTGDAAVNFGATGSVTSASDFAGQSYEANVSTAANKFVTDLNAEYLKAAKSLDLGAAASSFAFGSNDAGKFRIGGSAGGVGFDSGELDQSPEAIKLAASRAVFAAIQGSELPKYLSGVFDNISASTATQEQIDASIAAAQALKGFYDQVQASPFEGIKDLSFAATKNLIEFSGGLDKLSANLGTYYTEFFSAEEKRGQTLKNIAKTLNDARAEVGPVEQLTPEQIGNTSRAQFRAVVDGLDVTTLAGQKLYAAMLSVSGAFAGVTDSAADIAKAAKETADTAAKDAKDAADIAEKIADERFGLESKLLDLQGNTAALRQRELALLDPTNRGLQQQVYALEDMAEAAKAAEQAQSDYVSAVSKAGSAYTSAQNAVKSALNAVEAVQGQGTGAYLAAQDKVAAAQEKVANIAQQSAQKTVDAAIKAAEKMRDLSDSLRDFALDKTAPTERFGKLLTRALAGDADAMAGLTGAATSAIDSSRETANSGSAARLAEAKIIAGVYAASLVADAKSALPAPLPEADPLIAANAELAAAQTDLAEALRVANAINAPLTASVDALITKYAEAQEGVAKAQAELAGAQVTLNAIATSTAATVVKLGLMDSNLAAVFTSEFLRLDTSLDGILTIDEFVKGMAGKATDAELKAIYASADTNNDGVVSLLEAISASNSAISQSTATTAANSTTYSTGAVTTVSFAAADPIRSIFDNIDKTNALLIDAQQLFLTQLLGVAVDENLNPTGAYDTAFKGTYKVAADSLAALQTIAANSAYLSFLSATTSATATSPVVAATVAASTTTAATTATTTATTAPVATAPVATVSDYQRRVNETVPWTAAEVAQVTNMANYRAATLGMTPEYWLYREALDQGFNAGMVDKRMGYPQGTTNAWAAANGYPAFAKGTNYLPNDTLAMLHEGEAVIPKVYNPFNPNAQTNDDALVDEIRSLRADNAAQARALVQMQQRMTKLMERWDGTGMPETRVTA